MDSLYEDFKMDVGRIVNFQLFRSNRFCCRFVLLHAVPQARGGARIAR
jgi:hypothetical protein